MMHPLGRVVRRKQQIARLVDSMQFSVVLHCVHCLVWGLVGSEIQYCLSSICSVLLGLMRVAGCRARDCLPDRQLAVPPCSC